MRQVPEEKRHDAASAVLYKPYLVLTSGTKMNEFLFCYIDGKKQNYKKIERKDLRHNKQKLNIKYRYNKRNNK